MLAGVFLFSPNRPQNDETDSILMLHLAQEGSQKGGAGLWSLAGVTFRLLQLLDRNHKCKDMQSKEWSTRRISTSREKLGPTLTALLSADVPNPCSSIV